jgi:uncharacterized protein YecA (UPF0149 family)
VYINIRYKQHNQTDKDMTLTNEIRQEIKAEQANAMNRIRKEFETYKVHVNWDFVASQYAYVNEMNETLQRGTL